MTASKLQCGLLMALALAAVSLGPSAARTADDLDWNRARQLRQRIRQGETLSPEEAEYLNRARQALRADAKPQQPPRLELPVGLKPLSDMTAEDRYKGQDGGLYGGGSNLPPREHLEAAMRQARQIEPLDADGHPATSGKIGFVSIGMSNTTQEFSAFVRLADADDAKAPQIVIVDGAQGGMDAKAWATSGRADRPGRPNPWEVLDERLRQSRLSDRQVQVAWVKQARIAPAVVGAFPRHADEMRAQMLTLLNQLQEKFPNLRIAYLSSRTYGGYAKTPLNPEPFAYESAFVVRRLIQDQSQGDAQLNWDPDNGPSRAPLLLWGPYLWTDGPRGRKTDDLTWTQQDTAPDGTHPSGSGRQKVAELLLRFLKTDPTARPWFIGPTD